MTRSDYYFLVCLLCLDIALNAETKYPFASYIFGFLAILSGILSELLDRKKGQPS